MLGHVAKDAFERAELDRTVVGNDLVMFPAFLCREAQMGTVLTGYDITEFLQRLGQFRPGKIARCFIAPALRPGRNGGG